VIGRRNKDNQLELSKNMRQKTPKMAFSGME
jgi:hypothetical protein